MEVEGALGEIWSMVAGWCLRYGRGLLRAAAPGLVLLLAWWVLGQFQYTEWVLEEGLGLGERVSWHRYGLAGSFLLHIVVCVAACVAVATFVLEEAWHGRDGRDMVVAGVVLVATFVALCVCDGSLHRAGGGADGLEFAAIGDTRARLVFWRGAASAAFNTTVSVLGAAVVLMAAGRPCSDKVGASEQRDCRWKLAREARRKVGRWDGLLLHGSAVAVSGLLFANSWVNWPLVAAIGVDGEAIRNYEQIAMGSLGYRALVFVLLLAAIFVPTRTSLARELRARYCALDGQTDVAGEGDVTWRAWLLIAAPGILQVVVESLRASM